MCENYVLDTTCPSFDCRNIIHYQTWIYCELRMRKKLQKILNISNFFGVLKNSICLLLLKTHFCVVLGSSTQGWLKDVYKTTGKMSAYLFCIAVSDFESEKSDAGLWVKPVRIFGPPPYMRAGAGKYSPNLTAKFMTALENYFRVPYTFPKMDKIAVPHFLSGMIN